MRKLLALTLGLGLAVDVGARAQSVDLGGATKLDKSFCEAKSLRQTVIYVDDMMMIDGRLEWPKTLRNKLAGSLIPGEHVSLVELKPKEGLSTEIWTGCWPDYAPERRIEIKGQTWIFNRDPLQALPDQQGAFFRDLGLGETKIFMAGKRPSVSAVFSPDKAPTKQLLRALASDDGRFSNSSVAVRAILYSDMAENSDLGSIFAGPATPVPNFGQKLGSHLRNSVFYVFGVGEDVTNGKSMTEAARAFWSHALNTMGTALVGFGSDLNTSNLRPTKSFAYELTMKFQDTELAGKTAILTDQDGNIVDSWIGFNRLFVTGLSGSFSCAAENCKLDGTTTGPLTTTNAQSEVVALKGTRGALTGQIGPKDGKMFPLEAVEFSK